MDIRGIEAFIAWKKTKENRKPSGLYQYKTELTRFQGYLNGLSKPRHIWDAGEHDIRNFLADVGKGGAQSRRTRFYAIRAYFKYLVERKARKDNPAADIPLAKAPRRNTERSDVPRDEVKRLLKSPDVYASGRDTRARDKAILHLLYSGLKKTECRSLLMSDVNLAKHRVEVSGRKIPLTLTPEATDALREYLSEIKVKEKFLFPGYKGHLGEKQIGTILAKYVDACNLRGLTAETLRRSFAVHAIERGVGFVELIDALGKIDRVWLQELVDIARPRMIAAATGLPPSRVYPTNSSYDFYVDAAAEISKAHTSVLIVDPYPSEDFFQRYVRKVAPGVKIRILTNGTPKSGFTALDPSVESVARLFAASHALEVRISTKTARPPYFYRWTRMGSGTIDKRRSQKKCDLRN